MGCKWVGPGVFERNYWEFVEMYGRRAPPVEAELGLADVGGGADVVDGDVVGGDEAGEVEELVEVALRRQRHHHHRHMGR